jgi:hypothetical protein
MKHCLRLSSLLLCLALVAGCSSPYRHLQKLPDGSGTAMQYKPVFDKALYRCIVDGRVVFKKYHISGLLFFKTLENGTVRAIYQNEMGLTFFDFEWSKDDSFKINKLIPQFNKQAVVKVLKKDMELFLMKGLEERKEILYTNRGKEYLSCYTIDERGSACYVQHMDTLVRIENLGKRKTVTTINIAGKQVPDAMPQKARFVHHTANFTIELEKFEQDVNE